MVKHKFPFDVPAIPPAMEDFGVINVPTYTKTNPIPPEGLVPFAPTATELQAQLVRMQYNDYQEMIRRQAQVQSQMQAQYNGNNDFLGAMLRNHEFGTFTNINIEERIHIHQQRSLDEARRWVKAIPLPEEKELAKLGEFSKLYAEVVNTAGAMPISGDYNASISFIQADAQGILCEYFYNREGPWRTKFQRRFVVVTNGTINPDGTQDKYAKWVLRTHKTAKEAVAWTYGLSEEDYMEVVRT